MNILIPMAGNGQRFVDAGFKDPKPMIDVLGQSMIERVLRSLDHTVAFAQYIFVIQSAHTKLKEHLRSLVPTAIIVEVDEPTAGAACTALLASRWIDSDRPLLIANSDQIASPLRIHSTELPHVGIIWTFKASHPKWSYVATDHNGRVWGVAEKQVISNRATCGVYYYAHGSDFVRFARQMIEKNLRVNNEFYIAPVYNEMILAGREVWARNVKEMWGLGTPEDLRAYVEAQQE